MRKASSIVRATDAVRKNGRSVIFNDKLQDGARSFKVWGWNEADYSACVAALCAEGYMVHAIKTPVKGYGWMATGGNTRLHVYG